MRYRYNIHGTADLLEEYAVDNYSDEDTEGYGDSDGRVVIGKWRSNGEALEPKWRDGDSVPLAPFSALSIKRSGWRKEYDSNEDEDHRVGSRGYINIRHGTQNYKEKEGKFIDNIGEVTSSTLKQRVKTLQNYQNEYEMFENENDNPRPRKRRPPDNNEFPGSWNNDSPIDKRVSQNQAGYPTTRPKNESKAQENVELKTFLKMQGDNLSLSEILQEKNLTLADILKGKPNVISILKLDNDKKPETQEKAFSNHPEIIIVEKSDEEKSTIYQETKSTKLDFETTVEPVTNMESKQSEKDSVDETRYVQDEEIDASEKQATDTINPSVDEKKESEDSKDEFLMPLENRESLLVEATTVGNDSAKNSTKNEEVATESGERFSPESNDDDEIMEFSDYPLKMTKFVAPVFETTRLNAKPKYVPPLLGAIETEKITDDDDFNGTQKINNEIRSRNVSLWGVKNETNEMGELKTSDINSTEIKGLDKYTFQDDGSEEDEGHEGTEKIVSNDLQNTEAVIPDQKNSTLNHKLHEVVIPKVDPQSRAEILELFSSGSSAERLERLLASRNMSIEELIALRQRGSSQVHFAEAFKGKEHAASTSIQLRKAKTNHQKLEKIQTIENQKLNQTSGSKEKIKVPEKKETSSSIKNVESSANVPNKTVDAQKDKFDKDAEYLATDLFNLFSLHKNPMKNSSSSDSSPMNPIVKSQEVMPNIGTRPQVDLEEATKNSTKPLNPLPAVNNIQRDSDGFSYFTSIEAVKLPVSNEEMERVSSLLEETKNSSTDPSTSAEVGIVEEIMDDDLKSMTKMYERNDYEYPEKKTVSKVKPSIIASGGILGVTIVVFLSIFIACRIQQKKKFAYRNSFTKAVFHNPVMTARKLSNTSSVNTIMVDVVATSTTKRPQKHDSYDSNDFEEKSDIDNDSLDANDSWETIPDFMK
ncbi:uncharacterized protein LOC110117018 isoform X2 [Athalia rosae]|uniref:uncharacterized protein LOC110117018 isoform X2 n=1 Tax=Athalia rosae TaxID=37344 RepID=UPI002034008C|nr:uncharacterized protein LOC110117018 isoform X2 [Athalia rosae]